MTLLPPAARPPGDEALVFRADLPGDRPGMHALIAGVSDYRNLPGPAGYGMQPLSSTSLTAYLIFRWLQQTDAQNLLSLPLKTVRLLLSPTPGEIAASARFGPGIAALAAPGCSVASLQAAAEAWRQDAARRRDDATFFYFAGHGIQKSRNDQVLLLDSFGGPGPLTRHAVDVNSLRNGMAPTRFHPEIARVQFFFVDACRSLPPALLAYENAWPSPVFQVVSSGLDDRRAPIFFASLPDGTAQAIPREQTLFSLALLRCLNGRAAFPPDLAAQGDAQRRWYVSTHSLAQAFTTVLGELNLQHGGQQRWTMDGSGEDAILCFLPGTPIVPLTIEIDPAIALPFTHVSVTGMNAPPFRREGLRSPPDPHPFVLEVPAGYYLIDAHPQPPGGAPAGPVRVPWAVEPTRARVTVRMGP